MFTLTAHGLTDESIDDYDINVWIDGKQVARFLVYCHCQKDGWPTLLRLIANRAEAAERDGNTKWPTVQEDL